MDIPIRFKIYLFWKNLFSKKEDSPHIKITKEGRGVRSVLFFLLKLLAALIIGLYPVQRKSYKLFCES